MAEKDSNLEQNKKLEEAGKNQEREKQEKEGEIEGEEASEEREEGEEASEEREESVEEEEQGFRDFSEFLLESPESDIDTGTLSMQFTETPDSLEQDLSTSPKKYISSAQEDTGETSGMDYGATSYDTGNYETRNYSVENRIRIDRGEEAEEGRMAVPRMFREEDRREAPLHSPQELRQIREEQIREEQSRLEDYTTRTKIERQRGRRRLPFERREDV